MRTTITDSFRDGLVRVFINVGLRADVERGYAQWTGVGLKVFKDKALLALPPAESESFQLGDLVPAADDGVISVCPR